MAPGLLLDLDRTLVDLQSYTDYAAALADVVSLVGTWPDADVPGTDWDSATQACMSLLHSLGGDARWGEASAAIAAHERRAIPRSTAMPTAVEACAELVGQPVAVVTLLPEDVATEALAAHGIGIGPGPGHAVTVVVGRSGDCRPKPAPDGLLRACALLGVAPAETTMIGDSTWDEGAATAAGVRFVGVPSGPSVFGPGTRMAGTFAEALAAVRS